MENENVQESFIKFLRYYNVYDSVMKYRSRKLDSLFTREPERWLKSAFVWASTEEGNEFWSEVNKTWQQILKDGCIIIETDLPTDGSPDWYRGNPVYCEFSDDAVNPSFYTKGFCIFNDHGDIPFGMLGGTASGRIKDWNGGIYWKRYARPTTPPSPVKYYLLKQVDGKEEKYELTIEQRQVLGLEE